MSVEDDLFPGLDAHRWGLKHRLGFEILEEPAGGMTAG